MTVEFGNIFWPVFAAMLASGVVFEIFHFGLGLILTWRQSKKVQAMKEKIAAQMGIDPSQLDITGDLYDNGQFPNFGEGFLPPSESRFPPTTSGSPNDHGHGQYL